MGKCRAVSCVLENSRRSRRPRRLKSATSATAVCCPDESCLTVLNGRGRYQQRLAWDLVQLRKRQDQWGNCLTGDGVEVGPWRIGPGCLGLQAFNL
jgi:hypothetical protein